MGSFSRPILYSHWISNSVILGWALLCHFEAFGAWIWRDSLFWSSAWKSPLFWRCFFFSSFDRISKSIAVFLKKYSLWVGCYSQETIACDRSWRIAVSARAGFLFFYCCSVYWKSKSSSCASCPFRNFGGSQIRLCHSSPYSYSASRSSSSSTCYRTWTPPLNSCPESSYSFKTSRNDLPWNCRGTLSGQESF